MGSYAQAYRRTGKEALGQVVNFFENLRKRQEQKEVYNQLLNAVSEYQNNLQNATQEAELLPGGKIASPFEAEARAKMPENSLANFGIGQPEYKPTNPLGLPRPIPNNLPERQTREVPQGERYEKARGAYDEFANAIVPLIANPEIGGDMLSRINAIGGLLGKQVSGMKPEAPKISTRNPEYDIINELTGEVLFKGQEKKKPGDIEGRFENSSTGTYWTYDKNLGEFTDTGIPYDKKSGSSSKSGGKGGDDKDEKETPLKETVSELIANLKNLKPYTVNEDGSKTRWSDEDIKFEKDKTLEKIKLQLLRPRTYQFITNVEKKWGRYLPPDKLKSEAEKHFLSGNIGEDELKDIKTYLRYYSEDIYEGLTK